VVQHLPSKHKALSSNPTAGKKKLKIEEIREIMSGQQENQELSLSLDVEECQ
jgi:hypothetical protein